MGKEENIKKTSLNLISDFINKNISVLTLIAVFIGIASFIIDLNKTQHDDSIIIGAIGLIFLIGLLLIYISYIALLAVQPLLYSESDELIPTIQVGFIAVFMFCLMVSYIALISYFFVYYSSLTNWFLVVMILIVTMFFTIWFIPTLYTYTKKRTNIIKNIFILFALLDFVVIFIIRDSIIIFLKNYFPEYGQVMLLYCALIAFLSFGVFHFYIRKN